MLARFVMMGSLIAVAVSAQQPPKPSPFPSKNQKKVVDAPPPAIPKQSQNAKAAQDPPSAPQNAADRPTDDTGLACFYVRKPGTDAPTLRAAHPSFAIGTKVRVLNLSNQKSIVVTISDHGDLGDRIISVSQDAAEQLDFVRMGTARVHLEIVKD